MYANIYTSCGEIYMLLHKKVIDPKLQKKKERQNSVYLN